MGHILGIKFADYGQPYYFDAGPFVVERGRYVLVKTDQGLGMGLVVDVRDEAPEHLGAEEVKPIYRLANDEDLAQREENLVLAREAHEYSRRCIKERELDMKLVDVEVYFDRSKMVFYFTAPGRIDFRDLVKDLVRQYRTRIELRQIGVRHETQMIGALGNCGQTCCCRRFLRKFHPVTIKMAKEQNLFLNPTKISGICGRLLCCLSFEQHNYEEFHARCPRIGKKFTTTLGRAKVIRLNFFRQTVQFVLESGEDREVSLPEWESLTGRQSELRGDEGPSGDAFPSQVLEDAALARLEDPSAAEPAADRPPRRDRRRPQGEGRAPAEGRSQGEGRGDPGQRGGRPPRPEGVPRSGAPRPSTPRPPEPSAPAPEDGAERPARPGAAPPRRPRRKRGRRPGPGQGE